MAASVPPQYKDWSPTLLKRVIGLQLRQLRKEAGLSQQPPADRLQRTTQHISNIENALTLPTAADLEDLLILYGHPERVEDARVLLQGARKAKNWWEPLQGSVPKWFNMYLALESGAAQLDSFDSYIVPGLLQTADYAAAIYHADPDLTDEEISNRVEVRLGRKRILDRTDDEPARIWSVLDESVLYRRRGTQEVMRAQLRHLREMAERPRVDIQVIPLDGVVHIAQHGTPFTVIQFAADMALGPVIYVELLGDSLYREEPADITRYQLAMNRLRIAAASPDRSLKMIDKAIKEGS